MSEEQGHNKQFKTFDEFYPYYLTEHADANCRRLHFVGTGFTIVAFFMAIAIHPLWLLAMPLIGYFFAWTGHFFIEKNKPATFTYPVWSLIGDYKMFFSWITGKLRKQLEAAGVK